MHRAHLLSVPFENLDISRGRKIVVDQEAFIRKVVEERRGGFCYELNGAFAALLEALGLRVTLLSARAPTADASDGPEFDHLTLRVHLDEPWLADVGFGDSFLEPLRFEIDHEQRQDQRAFRITAHGHCLQVERTEPDVSWKGSPAGCRSLPGCDPITRHPRPRRSPESASVRAPRRKAASLCPT